MGHMLKGCDGRRVSTWTSDTLLDKSGNGQGGEKV